MAIALDYAAARIAGLLRGKRPEVSGSPTRATEPGISVVIPSRDGRDLLAAQLDAIVPFANETIVVDNGSSDGTAAWLRETWPQVKVDVSAAPLSFAHAVNIGIARARFSHVCLLNNDMLVEAGFFDALRRAFEHVPHLFCATAQIRFPAGVRREETGKAVIAQDRPEDFPLRCDEPSPGEDETYVLYGSGGCSLYDAGKLRALGCLDEAYQPAYVEDLDIGYRAWQRGWPTVYVAGAVVEHRHRATTSRFYTEEQLEAVLEENYLKFLARAVADRALFNKLWRQALDRLKLHRNRPAARGALGKAARIARVGGPRAAPVYSEEKVLALTAGRVAVFPGQGKEAAMVVAVDRASAVPDAGLLQRCCEVVLVRAKESSMEFQTAREWTARKWRGVG